VRVELTVPASRVKNRPNKNRDVALSRGERVSGSGALISRSATGEGFLSCPREGRFANRPYQPDSRGYPDFQESEARNLDPNILIVNNTFL